MKIKKLDGSNCTRCDETLACETGSEAEDVEKVLRGIR